MNRFLHRIILMTAKILRLIQNLQGGQAVNSKMERSSQITTPISAMVWELTKIADHAWFLLWERYGCGLQVGMPVAIRWVSMLIYSWKDERIIQIHEDTIFLRVVGKDSSEIPIKWKHTYLFQFFTRMSQKLTSWKKWRRIKKRERLLPHLVLEAINHPRTRLRGKDVGLISPSMLLSANQSCFGFSSIRWQKSTKLHSMKITSTMALRHTK